VSDWDFSKAQCSLTSGLPITAATLKTMRTTPARGAKRSGLARTVFAFREAARAGNARPCEEAARARARLCPRAVLDLHICFGIMNSMHGQLLTTQKLLRAHRLQFAPRVRDTPRARKTDRSACARARALLFLLIRFAETFNIPPTWPPAYPPAIPPPPAGTFNRSEISLFNSRIFLFPLPLFFHFPPPPGPSPGPGPSPPTEGSSLSD